MKAVTRNRLFSNFSSAAVVQFLVLFIIVGMLNSKSVTQQKYKLCAVENYGQKADNCATLRSFKKSEVDCVYASDRIECLRKLLNGKADFGVFNVEDLSIASELGSADNLTVTNEIRVTNNQTYKYDMVALVSNDVSVNSLSDLKGLRLCHPGFEDDDGIFTQYFEWKVVPQICSPHKSLLENRLNSLRKFFGKSCKAGQWSPIVNVDNGLKQRYHELCEMCLNPNSCARGDLYWGRTGPLNCLSDCSGNVAWVRLQDVSYHFADYSAAQTNEQPNCRNVSFLCPDGSTMPLTSENPCVWLSKPWPVVVTRREAAGGISSMLKRFSTTKDYYGWEGKLNSYLSNTYQPLHTLNPPLPSSQYLNNLPHFKEAIALRVNNVKDCGNSKNDRKINICVTNTDELNKCKIMSLAASTLDVNPDFGCILSENCTSDVIDRKADVLVISTEVLADIVKSDQFIPVLYQALYDEAYLRHVSVVVKDNSNIHTLEDLRGRKACFVNTDGFGFNSFVMTLKNRSLITDNGQCSYEKFLLKFFSKVCVIDDSKSTIIPTCFPDKFDGEYKADMSIEEMETLALECVASGGGDVTFINFKNINPYINALKNKRNDYSPKDFSDTDFRQIAPYKHMNGQYLMWATHGQILVHKNTSLARQNEIISAFLMMSKLFEYKKASMPAEHEMFNLFAPFDGKRDVLFEEAAREFMPVNQFDQLTEWKRSNYEINLKTTAACHLISESSSENVSSKISPSTVIIYILSLSYLILPSSVS